MRLRFLVDTGAVYTVLPRNVWSRVRLRPHRTVEFTLADGRVIARPVSACWIEIEGTSAPSPVVLGEADDGPLLGAVTLEARPDGQPAEPRARAHAADARAASGLASGVTWGSRRSPAG